MSSRNSFTTAFSDIFKTPSAVKHRSHLLIALTATIMALAATSCDTMRRFVSQDLEEEDFIIGKLYEDELVKETPYVPPTPQGKPSGGNALDKARAGGKDMKLYAAIEPWMGVPYKYGGTTKQGVDCSAFVGHVYKDAYGIALKRTVNDIKPTVTKISKSQLREGDLVFFVNSHGKPSHIGIYLHDGMFVHSSTSNGVSISTLENSYWSKHFLQGGRHPKR